MSLSRPKSSLFGQGQDADWRGAAWGRWMPLLVLVLVGLTYANTLNAPFLFDDAVAVVRNPTIRDLWSWQIFQPPPEGGTTTGRPLLNASFALNYAISGEAVWSYHLVNLLLHAAGAMLLAGCVRRILAGPILGTGWGKYSAEVAMVTAVWWAVHPLQTESVSGVAQRSEVLGSLFYLLTIYAFLRGERQINGRWVWWGVSLLSGLAGMASKEIMVTAPVAVLLIDRTAVAGAFVAAWRARWRYYLGLAATWLLLVWLLFGGGGSRGASAGFGLGVTPWTYLLKQCEALTTYLKLVVWPHPLVLDYGTAVIADLGEVWVRGLLLLGLFGATIWALFRRPLWGLAGAWWFLILAPSSSVVPLVAQTMAEHRMYLPLAAWLALGAVVAVVRGGRVGRWVAVLVTVAMMGVTIVRNRDYRDPLVAWASNVVAYPDGARGHNNYAMELARVGRYAESDAEFARALALQPDYVVARVSWGSQLLARGEWDAAIGQLRAAVELSPTHVDALVNLGSALVQAGRASEAVATFIAALDQRPAADIAVNLGIAYEQQGRLVEARQAYAQALQLTPAFGPALARIAALDAPAQNVNEARSRGLAAAKAGRWDEAAEQFESVLATAPDDADTLANLGNVRLIQGRAREAMELYERALKLRPEDARTRQNLQIARQSMGGD